eukprot:NODE_3109_length_1028_cov_190.635960_g2965_i0.p1 GENE.NODE_3109_length_1028_cov_190.635960_g2965_i0~~NODE_3109_length_1028_cov_190.635960_g2965_i0.p1  ORF type:complete len:308 (-),score=62.58 NODE_3109_length_1028_cov_190.635960_g2965_i0:105-986(-)
MSLVLNLWVLLSAPALLTGIPMEGLLSNVTQGWDAAADWYDSIDLQMEKLYNAWSSRRLSIRDRFLKIPKSHHIFDFIAPHAPHCDYLESYGTGDDEKRVCGLSRVAQGSCVVFSIGSNNQWEFEQAVHNRTKCMIHTFDCFEHHLRVPHGYSKRVIPHSVCLGGEYSRGKFLTWNGLLELTHQYSAPTHLKIDIEGFEYTAFRHMFRHTPQHLLPLQISMELHTMTNLPGTGWKHRFKFPGEVATFAMLLFRHGYLMIDRNDNPICSTCTEILLVRASCWLPRTHPKHQQCW